MSSSGTWSYEIKTADYDSMPDRLLVRLGRSADTREFLDTLLPTGADRDALYARIEQACWSS